MQEDVILGDVRAFATPALLAESDVLCPCRAAKRAEQGPGGRREISGGFGARWHLLLLHLLLQLQLEPERLPLLQQALVGGDHVLDALRHDGHLVLLGGGEWRWRRWRRWCWW